MWCGANFLMEPWGRSCFAMTWVSFLNVVIIGRECPQATALPLPRSTLTVADFPASSLEPGLPGSALWLDDEF